MSQSLSYLIQRLKPYWLDAAAAVAGIELNKIIHFPTPDGSLSPAEFYDKDEAGLIAALAATAAGSVVRIPSGTITLTAALAIPDEITLYGQSILDVILSGDTITMGDASSIENLSVINTANDANTLYGIQGPVIGSGYIYRCLVRCTQAGAGDAYAVAANNGLYLDQGNLYVSYSELEATSGSGDGYCGRSSAGKLYVWHSRADVFTTDRFKVG